MHAVKLADQPHVLMTSGGIALPLRTLILHAWQPSWHCSTAKQACLLPYRLLGNVALFDANHEPTMGGEDFSFFGQAAIPSSYMFLGTHNEKLGAVHALHSAKFKLDESIMPIGAAYHAALALGYLDSKISQDAKDEL